MDFSDFLAQLTQLNLPKDQYVIVGSAALAAKGIRVAKDLDVLVTEELWQQLRKSYTLTKTTPVENIDIGDIQILGHGSPFRNETIATLGEMIKTADIVSGHPILNLQLLRQFKKNEGREKDLKDVVLIDAYLAPPTQK